MILTGKVYDVLKAIALIYLPAVGSLYYGLAPLWGLPNADKVSGSILIIDTVLGGLLGISTNQYNKKEKYVGTMSILENTEGKKTYSLDVEGDLDELDQKSEITFKVNKA